MEPRMVFKNEHPSINWMSEQLGEQALRLRSLACVGEKPLLLASYARSESVTIITSVGMPIEDSCHSRSDLRRPPAQKAKGALPAGFAAEQVFK